MLDIGMLIDNTKIYVILNVKGKTNKVDRAKRMHCVRSERAIAITLVVRRL
jgi:hypothetical protein